MYVYRFLSSCGRLAVDTAREVWVGLTSFGAALIGLPLPSPTRTGSAPAPRAGAAPRPQAGPGTPPAQAGPARSAQAEPGTPSAGHPERLIPHVPLSPAERELWSQLR
ncbi:hypothetical protein O7606_09075 [Micromonospora sp. WMMD882]|uniref:DUF6059 family protein n=1 Tax=Micromonospora sp. WMMD882 TaxID=3015151 RepID=UPI00248C95DA|nr:DUF6059 family protein [Micromonospora sp. WMMD882]WBB81488.1 hypothetical protein O7606_09075 [Micromonospora sp. WMMD882]